MGIWDKTQEDISKELSKANRTEVQKQTLALLEILAQVGEAIQENKNVTVENIVRQVVGEVSVTRPEWIKELIPNNSTLENKIDLITSAINKKEVVKKMDFNRPNWLEEIKPKEIKFPEAKDFSKPQTDLLREILKAINEKEITEKVEIINELKIKQPDWWKLPDFNKPILSLASFLKKLVDKSIFKTTIENEVTIKNTVEEVTIKNPQKEVKITNIKEIENKLELMIAQLRALGTTGSGAGSFDKSGISTEAKQDPLASYKDAGMDLGTPMYFGYLNVDGAWYIKKLDTSTGTTYTKGDSDYTTGWSDRGLLNYDEFNNIF